MKIISYLGSALILASASVHTAAAQAYPQKSDLPTVYIETENHQSITSKENYLRATLRYVDSDGETYYDALGIRGRGNSTWGLAKKPYRVKFDKKQEFLGKERAKAKSWTFIANFADKSLMRNALAADLGTFAGQPFTAAAQFVDFVLNGKYVGNYQISDQVEVRAKRVDIYEQEDPMNDDSNITGGYLLEIDGFADAEPVKFTTAKGIKITVKSPDDEIIDPRQLNYIRRYVQDFENALFGPDFADPAKGYRSFVDESTLISWYVASEMTANPDAFWSTYIYKDRDDPKIYWGPMWDYDIAFNNCQRKGDMTRRTVLHDGFGADLTGVWVRRMWEDPWFVNAVNEKWKSMVEAGLEQHLIDFIDATEARLKASQALDGKLWPVNKRVYDEYRLFSTYGETVDFLRKFVRERISYLTAKFEEGTRGAVPTPPFEVEEDYFYRIHNAGTFKCADLTADGTAIVGNTYADGTPSQHWTLHPTSNGYYMIVNRVTGGAITDRAPYVNNQYERNSQLGVAEPSAGDYRQHWHPVPVPTGGTYVMENRATKLAWNNSGGSSDDGNAFISWTNDKENINKSTRQWRIIRDELKEMSGIHGVWAGGSDYEVTYSASASLLRFIATGDAPVEGDFCVSNAAGTIVLTGAVAESIDVSSLSPGVYVLTWNIDGRRITRKFVKI